MKIGITERGDAGIDLSWFDKLSSVDGAIIISKNFTSESFKKRVLSSPKPLILHCTCTGYGNSIVEPYVPSFKAQLDALKDLIERGFPSSNIVLRLDPIFPTPKGLSRARLVLNYLLALDLGITRVRISIIDEYKHVKNRYLEKGITPIFKGFSANEDQIKLVAETLNAYPQFYYETCAEDKLASLLVNGGITGCISNKDISIMGIKNDTQVLTLNPQNRTGCHCLSCKTELLTNRKRCPHGCLYCYWKN